jgi:predicted alpha/beta hydrolase
MKGQVPLTALTATALSDYAGITGHLLAKGHARTSGASIIAGYLGDGQDAAAALARFAGRYADQTEQDHEAVVLAARSGRLPHLEIPV